MLEPTHESEPFSRTTPGSQTLLRGLNLLRAFVSGAPVLSNAQLAERSGLPRPTVSRLTHSLVEGGYLEYDGVSKGYRLAPVCLSLARSFHIGRSELDAVLPLMGQVATAEQINVTLSAADGFWMVYLHTIRKGRGLMSRAAMTGTRFGMIRSSTGHAYLAGLPESRRQLLMGRLASHYGEKWPKYRERIDTSRAKYAKDGYCRSRVVLGMEGIATAVMGPDGVLYTLSVSYAVGDDDDGPLEARYAPVLLSLRDAIEIAWSEFGGV